MIITANIPRVQVPDWSREQKQPGRYEPAKYLLRQIRRYQKVAHHPILRLIKPWFVLAHRFWSVVCSADIPLNAQIGGGLMLIHPNGVVLHPQAKIGSNCLILQQVTIGTGPKSGVPEIGDSVMIGAGAKILGGVKIGRGACIGANAVVIEDVPAYATAVGIPARILSRGGGS